MNKTIIYRDGALERVIKEYGSNQAIYVNSALNGCVTQTGRYTVYPNAYYSYGDDGRYTKHIYIGSERVLSQVGGVYGEPRILDVAGHDVRIKVDYPQIRASQDSVMEAAYSHFDLPYNGTDHDDFGRYPFDLPGYWNGSLQTPRDSEEDGDEGTPARTQEYLYYYHTDHLGSSTLITDGNGQLVQQIEYLPYGEVFLEKQASGSTYATPYKFNGKELDEETGLYYYGARYMNPRLSIWYGCDPLQEKCPEHTSYEYTLSNPVNYKDLDGRSTHTDSDGKIITVINDKDLGVYRHKVNKDGSTPTPYQISVRQKRYGTSANGEHMGETKYWDEFISPETGNVMTNYRIQFGKSFDPIINQKHAKAETMNLVEIAKASTGGGEFDIKKSLLNVAGLLDGKYATSRSAGNFLAGYNAQGGELYGVSISFEKFQKLAGALHIEESHGKKLTTAQMAMIVATGTYDSSDPPAFKAPTWGEVVYQYRMSFIGWKYGESK